MGLGAEDRDCNDSPDHGAQNTRDEEAIAHAHGREVVRTTLILTKVWCRRHSAAPSWGHPPLSMGNDNDLAGLLAHGYWPYARLPSLE